MSEKKRTIMLGFHSQVDGRLMREWLTDLGYEVVESLDDTDDIDLVFMDSASARRLMDRAFGLKSAAEYFLPVLVAINTGENVGFWIHAGFDDVVRLPASKAEWNARIDTMLRLRRQSEELGRKSEMLHKALVESSSDQIFMLDTNGTYVASNDRVEHFGLERGDELVGKTIDKVFPKEVAPFYRTQLQRVLTEGKPVVFEHDIPSERADHYHLDTLYPVNLPDGTVMVGGICRDITERKQAEEKLKKSEKNFSDLVDNLMDGVAIANENAYHIYVNPRFSEITGYSKDELMNMTGWDFTRPKDRAELKQRMKDRLAGKPIPMHYDRIIVRKDGTEVPVEMSTTTTIWQGKKCPMAIIRDITERKQAEEKLKAANQQLQASNQQLQATEQQLRAANQELITSAKALKESELKFQKIIYESFDGISVTNEEGKIIVWNDALERITGINKTQTIDRYIWDVQADLLDRETSSAKRKEEVKAALSDILKTGTAPWLNKTMEREYIHPDGTVKIVSGSMYTIKTQKGFLVVSVSNDITESKRAEKALKEAQSNLQALLDNRIDSIWSLDRNYNYLVFNKSYADVIYSNLGIRLEKGMNALDIHPKEVGDFWKPKFDEVFEGKYVSFEFSQVLDGKEHFFEVLMNPIYTDNKVSGLSALSMDITQRKQAEKEVLILNKELEQRVKERTAQLEASNKELEAFAFSVSHDLRAPLRAIDGFTRILMEDYVKKLDDEGKRLGSIIQSNARKMGKLIDDLLAFSRLGRTSMQFSGIDMKNMANAIYHEATSSSERKRITFSVADLPNAYGDTNMLRQVWTNLISNAIKFSSKREKAVISITGTQDNEKTTYRISDNGAGFDMQYVNKIFDVFQRLHGDSEFPGTGVGLSLVQRIIQRHKGKIWAESEIDKGATFYFSLPKKGINETNKL